MAPPDLIALLDRYERTLIRYACSIVGDLDSEIAEVTKLSVTNIGFLIHTGLKKLRALLREQPVPDFDLPLRSTP